jgi:hypothetical protein
MDVLRLPAEEQYIKELDILKKAEQNPIPPGWQLSPAFRSKLHHWRQNWERCDYTEIYRQ